MQAEGTNALSVKKIPFIHASVAKCVRAMALEAAVLGCPTVPCFNEVHSIDVSAAVVVAVVVGCGL
jgi:hypothetical protein